MRQILFLVLVFLMTLQLAAQNVASQITAMPQGTRIELRLKDKQKLSGTTGVTSASGFAFIDASAGEHQIAFADVASVKRIGARSHTTRNVLIVVGIGVAIAATAIAVHAKKCPLGCNSRAGF